MRECVSVCEREREREEDLVHDALRDPPLVSHLGQERDFCKGHTHTHTHTHTRTHTHTHTLMLTHSHRVLWLPRRARILISEAPGSGPLSLAPVSAKEFKERAFQDVL